MKKQVYGKDLNIGKKECSHCGHAFELTAENFHRNIDAKDGFDHRCKTCALAYKKEHYMNNKERLQDERKKYYHRKQREKLHMEATAEKIREHAQKISEFENFTKYFGIDELIMFEHILYHNIMVKLKNLPVEIGRASCRERV